MASFLGVTKECALHPVSNDIEHLVNKLSKELTPSLVSSGYLLGSRSQLSVLTATKDGSFRLKKGRIGHSHIDVDFCTITF